MRTSTNGQTIATSHLGQQLDSDFPFPLPLGLDDEAFSAWKRTLREHYQPPDPLAAMLLLQLIDAAARYNRATRAEPEHGEDNRPWIRLFRLAESSFNRALLNWYRHTRVIQQTELHAARLAAAQEKKHAAKSLARKQASSSASESEPASAPKSAYDPFDKTGDIEIDTATPINWEDHIVYDAQVDNRWPIIHGTKHTAEGIAAGMIYGWSFRHMLAYYPGITVDDIRAVIACEKVGMCGPWPDGVRPQPKAPDESPADRVQEPRPEDLASSSS
jgi:uncharacterized protein (DUF433 family)